MKNRKTLAIIMAISMISGSYQSFAQTAEELFPKGIQLEEVKGELEKAIEVYQTIITQFSDNRPLASKAQLHIGLCYEKLGNTEARKAYERVVRNYSDQADIASEARIRLATLTRAAGASNGSTLAVRRVLADADVTGKVSLDGRFVSFTDWEASGNLAIHDLTTGQNKLLTDKGILNGPVFFAEYSVPSPDSKSIAYAWDNGGSCDLCVVGLDGSKPRILQTAGDVVNRKFPLAWSPDSKHVLAEFEKTDGTRDMMLVAVSDGSTKLLKMVGKDISPAGVFSPDGRYIAWSTTEGISLFELQTGIESPLIPDLSKHSVLGWAPDGKHILFSSERSGTPDAWLIGVTGGKAQGDPVFIKRDWGFAPMGFTRPGAFYYAVNNTVGNVQVVELDPESRKVASPPHPASLRGNTWAPAWSPDGRFLAFILAREPHRTVIVHSLDTGEEREFEVGERTIELGATLRWFPDGRGIAVPAFEPGKGAGVVRIDVQTGRVSFLMPLPAEVGFPHFEVHPDGGRIFYTKPLDAPGSGGLRLVARDLKSGEETTVVERRTFFQFALSPDGRWLLVAAVESHYQVLLVMPANGGEGRELVRVDSEKEVPFGGSPWWSPDGRYVYFMKGVKGEAQIPYETRKWHLWQVAAGGGEPRQLGLTLGRQMGGLRLHPDGRRLATTDFTVNLEVWVMENFLPKPGAAPGGKMK